MSENPLKISYGKPKKILNSSIDAAKKAIKNYNDVEDLFRIQNFVILMNIAYTRLFHLYFLKTQGDIYYYKNKNGNYQKTADGQKMAWDLSKCIKEFKKYESLENGVEENIIMFVGIRNKIEHTAVDELELELVLFGEIQAYVINYNKLLIKYFGVDLSNILRMPLILNLFSGEYENVIYNAVSPLFKYISEYKEKLSDEIINDDSFAIKLIAMPNIVNKRSAPAVSFISKENMTEDMKFSLIGNRDKIVTQEVRNIDLMKPKAIIEECINELEGAGFSSEYTKHNATQILEYLNIFNRESKVTNTKYCIYDQVNNNFLYTNECKQIIRDVIRNISKDTMNEEIRSNQYYIDGGGINE